MKNLIKTKWTSIRKLNGWLHYEVLNVFKKEEKIELFPVCERNLKLTIPIQDLKNESKWIKGWSLSKRPSDKLK
jgi:tryptophan-rich hypothetical protein